jgi:IPT/TIG domain
VVVSSSKITAVAPAQAAGLHNTFVNTPVGTSAAVLGDLYTYVAPPAITSVSPNSGPAAGGNSVTINGSGFTGATQVVFGAVPATSVVVVSSSKITAVAPAQAAGLHNTFVTTPVGTSATVLGDLYTYH